jgi:hypothetical protein
MYQNSLVDNVRRMAIRIFHASKQQPQIIVTEFTWNATYIGTIALGIRECGLGRAGLASLRGTQPAHGTTFEDGKHVVPC